MAKIRVALLGCGGIQRKHYNTVQQRDDAEIVALCDVGLTHCDDFLERVEFDKAGPLPQRFDDPTKMYAEARPDAVSVCTPHTLHFQHGMQALEAGCHVLMEKPMVTDAGDAYTLAAKVKETGKVFIVGYNTPCTPEIQYLRELVRSNELGRLELVSGYLSQNWMKPTAGKWRQDPKLSGGGQAYDSGAHPLNTLCYVVESHVAEVFAFVDNHSTPVDINSAITIRFENGVMASMAISGNCPASDAHMSLMFENGKVDVDPWNANWIRIWKGREAVKYPPITAARTQPMDNLLDAIQGKASPRTTPENGIIQSELMDAIYESQRTGQPARPKRHHG